MNNSKSFDLTLDICIAANQEVKEFLRSNLDNNYPISFRAMLTFLLIYLPIFGIEVSLEEMEFLDKLLRVRYFTFDLDERFGEYARPIYYRNKHGIIVIVDMNKRDAYNFLKGQFQIIEEGCNDYPIIYIVGLETGSITKKLFMKIFMLNKLNEIRVSAFLKKIGKNIHNLNLHILNF